MIKQEYYLNPLNYFMYDERRNHIKNHPEVCNYKGLELRMNKIHVHRVSYSKYKCFEISHFPLHIVQLHCSGSSNC